MATAVPPKPAVAKYELQLEQQLAQASRRIRLNDLLAGVLLLVAIALGYVAVMIALDRWVEVPAWGRQLGFLGLFAGLVAAGYYTVFRPLRRAVNPLYAAKQVEDTIPDAKNGIVNYVDLHDVALPESIRAAVGTKAAKQFAEADLNEALDTRRLLQTGIAVAALVVTLAVLFLVFRPAQFFSLLGRTLTPFSSGAIATRTTIAVTEPAGGDQTVTVGEKVVIVVSVNGRVPDPADPNRLRVRLRHNPADPNAEEVPLEPAGSNREWQVKIPDHLIQNGFWYTVAGGDAVTPEYRIQVRSRPLFTAFEARYECPAYLRLQPEVVREPQLEAYRGTQVTLTAKANRELKAGRMQVAGQPNPIPGEVVGEARDSVRFRLTVAENGSYQIFFTATTGEANADSPPYPIKVISDQPPAVTITAPAEQEATLPANGLLAVDGVVGDDFGVDTVTLRLRMADGGGLALQPRPFEGGKSFKRDGDHTYPTSLEYKDSVPLTALKDEAGRVVTPAAGMVLEYWLEATDNCTVPKANVGKSRVQRVRFGPPVEPMKQPEQKQQADQRKQAEAKLQQAQDQKFDTERRDPPPQPRPDAAEKKPDQPNAQPKEGPGQPMGDQPPMPGGTQPPAKPGPGGPMPPPPMPREGEPKTAPMPKEGDPTSPPMPKEGQPGSPMANPPGNPAQPPMPQPGNPGQQNPNPQPMGGDEQNNRLKDEANRIEKAIQEEKKPGEARGAGEQQPMPAEQQPPSAEKKGDPGAKPDNPPAESKAPGDAGMGNNQPDAAQPKPAGKPPEPPAPAEKKAERKPDAGKPNGAENTGDPEQKQPPVGGSAAKDKPEPKPGENATPKPAEGRGGEKGAQPEPAQPKQPGKPQPAEARPDPNGDQPPGAKPGEPQPQSAAKGPKPTPAAEKKDAGKPMPGGANPNQKPEAAPAEPKPADQNPMGGDDKQPAAAPKGEGKKPGKQQPGAGSQEKNVDSKDLEQNLKDLTSGDQKKQKAAKDKIDQEFGKGAGEKAEQMMKDLKSDDRQKREQAEKDLQGMKDAAEKLHRENVKRDPNGMPEKDLERLMRDAENLNSPNEQERKDAEDRLDKTIGKQAREDLQDELKKKKPGDKAQDEKTKQKLGEMAKKHQDQAQNGNDPSNPDQQPGADAKATAKDDPQAGQAGEKQPQPKSGGGNQQPKVDPKQLEKAVQDMASNDPERQKQGREQLDKMVGEGARKEAEQIMNDLKSDDPKKREAAQKKLDEINKQMEKAGGGQQPKREPTAEEQKQLADAAKDLASGDPQKQEQARKKLDEKIGPDARKQVEQMAKDLQSDDKAKREAAEQKLKDLQKQANGGEQQKKELTAEEKKQLAEAAKDLGSNDPEKKKAAQDKLDRMMGKDAREKAEQMAKDLQSDDKATREAAQKKLEDLQKQANGGEQPKKELTPEEKKQLADIAKGLASKDQAKQEEAGKKFGDTQLAKDLAEGLKRQAENLKNQQNKPDGKPDPGKALEAAKNLSDLAKQLEDMKSGDPKKAEEAMKNLKDLAEKMKQNNPPAGDSNPSDGVARGMPGGSSADNASKPLKENEDFGKLSSELQLEKFKKAKDDPELLKKLGYNQQDYDRFLKGFAEMVEKEKEQKEQATKQPDPPQPNGPRVNVGEARKVETRGDGTTGNPQSAGAAPSPPGYTDAQKKFSEGLGKTRPREKK